MMKTKSWKWRRTTTILLGWMMLAALGAALHSWSPAAAQSRPQDQALDPGFQARVLPVNADGQAELQQGQAFLIEVRDPERLLASVRVSFQDQNIPCLPNAERTLWQGLAAVDWDQPPGDYELFARLQTTHGASYQGRLKISVEKREFGREELRVAPSMVAPPSEARARISEDRREFKRVWANPAVGRFWEGSFLRPTPGRVTSEFGEYRVYNEQLAGRHGGVDLAAAVGEPIISAAAGKVVMARDCYYTGGTVVVDHGGGLFTVYCHLSDWPVVVGQMVEKGELIGLAGATGRVTGPHLHWGARVQGIRVDPLTLIELNQWLE